VTQGTYEEVRGLSNEISRGLGSAALFTVIAFCIYHWITGGVTLGLLWIPFIFLVVVLATLAVGLPVLLFRMAIEIRRPTIGFGWFFALKIVAALWFFASFFVAWRIAAAVADWMD
jgi:hypothetical protein